MHFLPWNEINKLFFLVLYHALRDVFGLAEHPTKEEKAFWFGRCLRRKRAENWWQIPGGRGQKITLLKCHFPFVYPRLTLGFSIHWLVDPLLIPPEDLSSTIVCQLFSFSRIFCFWFIITRNCSLKSKKKKSISFCCTAKWISYTCMYIYSFLDSFPWNVFNWFNTPNESRVFILSVSHSALWSLGLFVYSILGLPR